MADIDELQIKIKADSAKASDSIDKLASSLDSLGKVYHLIPVNFQT